MGDLRKNFDSIYRERILGERFCEVPSYYVEHRPRYLWTVERLRGLYPDHIPSVLEVGGGQIALMMNGLFGSPGLVVDLTEQWADPVRKRGLEFRVGDLVHDDLEVGEFDIVVLCEVIEHMPIPGHLVIEKLARWLKPGGILLMTTPNLYRLRNVCRMALGMPLFCPLRYPPRGGGIGHPFEYSPDNLRWQVEESGLELVSIERRQLTNTGATVLANIARKACSPLLMIPRFRDQLVAIARKTAVSDTPMRLATETPSIVRSRFLGSGPSLARLGI